MSQIRDWPWRRAAYNPLVWFLSIAALWLSYSLPTLNTFPAPYGDEVWIGSISVQWLEHGNFDVPPFGDSPIYNDYQVFRLYNIGLAVIFKIFGVGLTQARAFSVLGSLVSAWLLFAVGCRLYGVTVGLLASALYLFSTRVLWLGHVGRTDMWVNVGALSALLLFLVVRANRRGPPAFLLGLFIAAIVDIYLTAAYASLAISLLMAVEFRRRAEWRLLAFFALGGLIGTAAWFAVRLFPDVVEKGAQFQMLWLSSFGRSMPVWQRLTNVPNILYLSFIGYSAVSVIEFPFMAAGVVGLWQRRRSSDWIVAGYLSIIMVCYLITFTGHHHFIYLMPAFCLAGAAALRSAAEWIVSRLALPIVSPDLLAAGLAMPLLGAYVAAGLYLGWQNRQIDYFGYANALRALTPGASNVLGEGTWWYTFRDGTYTIDEYLILNQLQLFPEGRATDAAIQAIFLEREINAVLLDESFGFSLQDRFIEPVHGALGRYLHSKCVLAGVVEGYVYGVEQSGPAIKRTQVFLCPPPR
jgi:hypothetical protein